MALTQTVAPTVQPIQTQDAREHLRVDLGVDDSYIDGLIRAATKWAETFTHRQFAQATYRLTLDQFPSTIYLPNPELRSVTSVVYTDTDGNEATVSASDYKVDTDSERARIVPAYSLTWPSTRAEINAVRVLYVCGYASSGSPADYRAEIPEPIKQAIKLLVGEMYENREQSVIGVSVTPAYFAAESLLSPYRVVTFQ